MVGTSLAYRMPFLGPLDYLVFLLRLPFTMSANYAAYVLVAGTLVLSVSLVKRDGTRGVPALLLCGGLLAASLAAIYPVSYAILVSYRTPLTSYRVPFLLNTVWLVWAVYTGARLRRLAAVFIVASLIIVPGTERTRRYWDRRMARAEAEGVFYLENPDKLIYSEEAATWFLPGVNRFYSVQASHYVNKLERTNENARAMLDSFPTIWRYQNGRFIPDDNLFRALRQENFAR